MSKKYNTDSFFNEIDLDEAKKKAENGEEFYLLYPDNTEGLYEGQVDLERHSDCGGGFGIE